MLFRASAPRSAMVQFLIARIASILVSLIFPQFYRSSFDSGVLGDARSSEGGASFPFLLSSHPRSQGV